MLGLVIDWREKGSMPDKIQGQRVVDGKTEIDMPIYPYPIKTGWANGDFVPVEGPRRGVDRVAEHFRPVATE